MKKLVFFLTLLQFAVPIEKAYAWCNLAATTTVAATGTSGVLVAENKQRKCLLFQNVGAATVYVKPDSAHSGTEGVQIVAGGNWEPAHVPHDAFYVKSASGTVNVVVIEGE